MSTGYICNGCGEFFTDGGRWLHSGYSGSMEIRKRWDLCPECMEGFAKWLDVHSNDTERATADREHSLESESVREQSESVRERRYESQDVTGSAERATETPETSHDTREKLEADVRRKQREWSQSPCALDTNFHEVIGWLDRQAAITERETLHSHPMCAGSDACPALNRPNGESADRETPDTAGIGTSKDEIRDFDVWNVAYEIYCAGGYVDNGNEPNPPTDGICELLDRQAAITEREVKLRELHKFEENHRWHVRSIEEVNQQLNERIAELKAEIATLKEHRAGNVETLRTLADANAEMAWRIQQLEKEVSR